MANRSRGSRVRNTALIVIEITLVLIVLVCAFNIGRILYRYWVASHTAEKVAEEVMEDPKKFDGEIDFDKLLKINPDVQGWLYQEDSVINYPVVKGDDNDKYLHTLIDGTWNGGGTLFCDCNNADNFKDFNTIIYGHHMKDKSMFHCLRGYTKEEGYYEGHKTFDLITPDRAYTLKVFATYITPATSDTYNLDYPDKESKQKFIDSCREQSTIDTGVKVTTKDRLVTLSTCAYDYDEARYVVVCKMVPKK